MGIDLLDIVYRLEQRYTIRLEREDFTGPMEEWEAAAKAGAKAQRELHDRYIDRLTVGFLCDIVEQKIRERNEGKSDFPNVLAETRSSVQKELGRLFEIDDPASIADERTLGQLAERAVPGVSGRFWRRFYRTRSSDSSELKAIKSFARSSQLISCWTTFWLSLCLSVLLLLILWLASICVTPNIPEGYAVPIIVTLCLALSGRQTIINFFRRRRPPKLIVGELIEHLADQRPDRTVRADGFPYSREDIERDVAEVLCEALAVEPEDVTPDARIYKDLGAE